MRKFASQLWTISPNLTEHGVRAQKKQRNSLYILRGALPLQKIEVRDCKIIGSFIIFQNGYLNNFNPFECSQGEALNRVQRAKTPRNIVSLMRRRNALNA